MRLWPLAGLLLFLPAAAQAYLDRIEKVCEVPIAIVSTGPERDETILRHHPFAD